MNKTIEIIKNHRSIRQYLDEDISDEIIDEIVKTAQSMPNSINGQQTTVIVVRDKEKKENYSINAVKDSIDTYDNEMENYLKKIGRYEKEGNWSTLTSSIYQTVYYPKVKDAMKKQGFTSIK